MTSHLSENDWKRMSSGMKVGRGTISAGIGHEDANAMRVSRRRPSPWGWAVRCLVTAAVAAVMIGGFGQPLLPEHSAVAEAQTPSDARRDVALPDADAEDGVVHFPVYALPARETYLALQRVRYLPGAHLAEQPKDGPRLLNVLSGDLTIRVPVAGAALSRPSADGTRTASIEPGIDQLVTPGSIVMIPAGIPAQVSNTSDTQVEWIQFQIETPATLCICGEDRSAVEMELLSSRTLPDPILPPVIVSLTRQHLDPAAAIPSSSADVIRLIGAVDDSEPLLRGEDGSARNDGPVPIEVVVATIASVDATDPD